MEHVQLLEALLTLKLAIRHELPSAESELIQSLLSDCHDVTVLDPYNPKAYSEIYDLAVCIGPVSSIPLCRKRILMMFGQTQHHHDFSWDAVVVSSRMAMEHVFLQFGHGCLVRLMPPPLTGLELAARRIVRPQNELLHVSDGDIELPGNVNVLYSWGHKPVHFDESSFDIKKQPSLGLFNIREFNSRVKAGAIGYYVGMKDGYDIQVRRHLSLGGSVVCSRNRDVLGDLADLCSESVNSVPKSVNPVDCSVDVNDYFLSLQELIARI